MQVLSRAHMLASIPACPCQSIGSVDTLSYPFYALALSSLCIFFNFVNLVFPSPACFFCACRLIPSIIVKIMQLYMHMRQIPQGSLNTIVPFFFVRFKQFLARMN